MITQERRRLRKTAPLAPKPKAPPARPHPDSDAPLTLREVLLDVRPKSVLLYPQSAYLGLRCYVLYRRVRRALARAARDPEQLQHHQNHYPGATHASEWDLELRRDGRAADALAAVEDDAEAFFRLGVRLLRNAGRERQALRVLGELKCGRCARVVCCCPGEREKAVVLAQRRL